MIFGLVRGFFYAVLKLFFLSILGCFFAGFDEGKTRIRTVLNNGFKGCFLPVRLQTVDLFFKN